MLAIYQCIGVAVADSAPPVWTVPVQQTSDDGYALLGWEPAPGGNSRLFKITETFNEQVSVHYTEATDLRAWRVDPGDYEFIVQSCVKTDDGAPDCGDTSQTLILNVSEALTPALLTEAPTEASLATTDGNVDGGPDQLQPGHWYDPSKDGHGWSFYWANRLALSPNDPLFGNDYDLVGIWYTYEAKRLEIDSACPDCDLVASEYRPVALKLKAVSTGSGSYGGSVYASRADGSEVWIGSAGIVFGSDNSHATITWSANFKKERLADSDSLELLLASNPAIATDISHFSGLWERSGDSRYLVVTSIGDTTEVVTVIFHDDAGDPTWVQAINTGSAVSSSSNFCLAYQKAGYPPHTAPPSDWSQAWYMSGCNSDQPVTSTNRNGRRYFSGLDKEYFWADFTLPGTNFASGSIHIGTKTSPVVLEKTANFHGVSFDAAGGSSCILTALVPVCEVRLTWFTDGNYPNATVYSHNISDNTYTKVLTSNQAAMVDIPYQVSSAGQYEFELHMGNGLQTTLMARSGVFTATEDTPEIQEAQPETPPAPASAPAMTASSSSSKVGATAGSFRVNESGSASYNVPILTAPASGGVAPQISLNYDSQSGNGEVGVGWSIGGVSAISLCPQTIEQDGISGSKGIRLDGDDRFCLDGQRLIVDSSTGAYGKNGTQYRTEIDGFSRITSYGVAGNGPAWFKVEHKDGSVTEYGNSADSRIEARGSSNPATAFTWAQNRFEDRFSNYILYKYLENSSGPVAFVLQTIDYTGNVRAGTSPSARLSFTYRERDASEDLIYSYFAGVQVEQRRLLQSIRSQGRINAGSPLEDLRFYELDYEEDGVGRNILAKLTECRSVSRSICYKPTHFSWLKSESKIDTSATVHNGLLPKSGLAGLLLADVSGDGRPDLLYTQIKKRNYFLHIKEATASAGFSEWTTSYKLPNKSDGSPPQVFAIDLNADGIQDVIYSKYSKKNKDYTWVALISDGNGFSAEKTLNSNHRFFLNDQALESRFQVMDFNGDGLSDILHAHTDVLGRNWQLTILLNTTVTGGNPTLSAPIELDVTNTDLFPFEISGDWGIDIKPPLFEWEAEGTENDEIPGASVFDFNGDGAVDLLLKVWRSYRHCILNCVPQASASVDGTTAGRGLDPVYESKFASFWVLMESNGQNAFTRNSIVALGAGCTLAVICQDAIYSDLPRSDYVWPVDINADGLADLAWGDTNRNWSFQLNTGNGFSLAKLIGRVPDGISKFVRFEDWNGDSFPDLVYPSNILDVNARWMINQNHFGREFAAVSNTQVLAGNVGGDADVAEVDKDSSIFADFSGDGKIDQLLIMNNENGEIVSTSIRKGMNINGNRDVNPANVITSITNGFGVKTEITYKPLTDAGVYSRMHDSVNADWGNGSAVYDMIAPIFVVSAVQRSAPVYNAPTASSQVLYHYVGAKLQAGGRGFLGFGEVISYDPQLKIRTNSRYRQDFPFIGMLADTTRVSNASGSRFSSISNTTAGEPNSWGVVSSATTFPSQVSGTPLSYVLNQWSSKATSGNSILPYISDSIEVRFTLEGSLDRKELITHKYDAFGNVTSRSASTYASNGSFFAREATTNTYSNDPANWILGQLQTNSITYSRVGKPSITRKSRFAYDSVSGALRQEVTDPGSNDLGITTDYKLDSFGNRWRTTVTGIDMSPRSTEEAFDPLGRFVNETTNALNQTTRTILTRDVFGNPLKAQNIDGVVTTGAADRMGRPFVSFTQTGVWSKTIQYSVPGTHCPGSTSFRTVTTKGGGATQIDCFDMLERTVRTARKGFNSSYIYTDQYYDSSGRVSRVSEPFFAGHNRHWNVTAYDALGRVTDIESAGGDDLTQDYDNKAINTCTAAGARVTLITNGLNQQHVEVNNAKGETTAVYDDQCGLISYDYDATGNLTRVTSADGNVVTMSYDVAGRKTSMDDPDKGYWQYAYNALGEITRQLDSKNQAVDFNYDPLGRVTNRRELKNVSSLSQTFSNTVNRESTLYKTSGSGKGQVSSVVYRTGEAGAVLHKKAFSYDVFGRVIMVSTTVDGVEQFVEETTYDQYSRLFQQFDASGDYRGLRYVYSNGYLSKIKEAREGTEGTVYQHVLAMDARGNVTTMQLGNGVTAYASYDEASGKLKNLSAFDVFDIEKQNVNYLFDVLGNLKSRDDHSGFATSLKEGFHYDSLNRLERVQLTAPALGINSATTTLSLNYTRDGNINCKSDVAGVGTADGCFNTTTSNYSYGQNAGPHAVTNAGGVGYKYDVNGNQTSSNDGRNIAYSVFDKPVSISKGAKRTEFSYGVGNSRYQRKDYKDAALQKRTLYLNAVERITENDSTYFKRYLGGVAISTYYPSTGEQQLAYLLKDHIGSIYTVLDEIAGITSRMHFSAFGQRQNTDWQTPLSSFLQAQANKLTTQGFTGHEQVDSMGIVHMNGRIYDPKLGRFLQADPVVQAPKNSQSLNRYSYVLNNPLSYTDPSGYFSLKSFIKKWGPLIIAGVASYFTFGAASAWAWGLMPSTAAGVATTGAYVASAAIGGAAAGFVGGAIISRNLKGAVKGAFTGAIMGGVAGYFGNSYSSSRIVVDSLAGGVSSEIYGQRFKDGLLFGALISSATFITVRLRAYQMEQSKQFPGQIGESEGYRGITGKLGGERTYEDMWFESGAAKEFADGKPLDWIFENKYLPYKKTMSPLGGYQGGEGMLFAKSYKSGGLLDYVIEGYAGVHDTFNQPYFYTAQGTNRIITGSWQRSLGYAINSANVVFASALVIPALIPDYMRHFYFQAKQQ